MFSERWRIRGLPTDRAGLAEIISQVAEPWAAAEDAVVVPAQENLPPFDPSLDRQAWLASVDPEDVDKMLGRG